MEGEPRGQEVRRHGGAAQGYGTARTWARVLGYRGQANLLQRTLNEEGKTDHHLTKLALKVNVAAKN